ncbi:helix-turn-helix transcriptional regulator [Halopiger thermotolerans]
MYADDSRGLESPDTTDASLATDQRLVADGGATWTDLTGFQRDCLEALARLERNDQKRHGNGIKHELEREYGEVNHGRLYPNLDTLVELDLIEKSSYDRRTNEYALTDDGRTLLRERTKRLADTCEIALAATDGGDLLEDGDAR